ncbi:hypothetical protein ILFOPFJJ_04984 [Ensifer psoraleae]|nr:hypothetical protein [Sinorhizobium psoraleae]
MAPKFRLATSHPIAVCAFANVGAPAPHPSPLPARGERGIGSEPLVPSPRLRGEGAGRRMRGIANRPHPLKMNEAPAAISAKPMTWFQPIDSFNQKIEKMTKMVSVITSCIVFSCAAE